jgi:ribonuclease T2
MLEISPSEKLVQHEWVKHGTCSGLGQSAYFAKAAKAFGDVAVPLSYFKPKEAVSTTPDEVRAAFVKSNPSWPAGSVAATCRRGELAEVWICLDKQLAPRACSRDVSTRHCGDRRVRMRAVRGNWPR